MRDIMFRGKRFDNGEWVEGYFCIKYFQELPHERFVIQYKTKYDSQMWQPEYMVAEVDPATVGQYIGLTDKNGKKIFEGDIVRHHDENPYDLPSIVEMGRVYWDEEYCGWRRTSNGAFHHGIVETYRMSIDCVYEVIGNIYDNPELLEQEG